MVTDALAAGASVYDLRGISDTLALDDHLVGLVQFKLGTGGEAIPAGETARAICRHIGGISPTTPKNTAAPASRQT